MKSFTGFIEDFVEYLIHAIWYGFIAFLIVAVVAIVVASIVLSFILLHDLLAGVSVEWYEIVAPFVLFFAIGTAVCVFMD